MSDRTIALVGASPSRKYVKDLADDVEIWVLNRMAMEKTLGDRRIDRVFEVHPSWFILGEWYVFGESYTKWLEQNHPYPIYVHESLTDHTANSIAYPLTEVLADLFVNFHRGDKNCRYMTSTYSYMLGLAIHERPAEIKCLGFEMPWDSEWQYQRPGATFLMGLAGGRDIKVWTPEEVSLIDAPLYGWEVTEMIPRQLFEEFKIKFTGDFEASKAKLNVIEGKGSALASELQHVDGNEEEASRIQEEMRLLWKDREHYFADLHRFDAVMQLCTKFIKMCDRQEVPIDLETQIGGFKELSEDLRTAGVAQFDDLEFPKVEPERPVTNLE